MRFHRTCLVLALAGVPLLPAAAEAADSFDSCSGMITSLPATISSQGTWCMTGDLATSLASGAAITVATNNVTIDCNGFKLGGLAAGAATATVGVRATDRANVVVRHCNVRGFRYGVQGTGSGFLVEDNRFEANTQRGILLGGDANIVRGNQVVDTGGSSTGTGAAYAIELTGDGVVSGNGIIGVVARASSAQGAFGIRVLDDGVPANADIAENRVGGIVGDGAGPSVAVRSYATGRVSIRGNVLFGTGAGVGVVCAGTNGAVRDNSILGFATALSGCSNDGGNVAK